MKLYFECVEWKQIKEDCKYDEDDDNNGYVYGIHYLDEECQIVDAEWFKSLAERNTAVAELHDTGYKDLTTNIPLTELK